MNLNEDFIAIQGIFLSFEKSAGSLKKIKYGGGNKSTILHITTELHKFLSSKNYIKNDEINDAFNEQLTEICLFLILNTELRTPLEEPSLQHLINIMPQLSTCLLANIVVELDLSPEYCKALHRFNLGITQELLLEMVPCIKKCKLKTHLKCAYEFLKLIVLKVSASTEKEAEDADKLADIAAQMLLNLTGLHGEQAENVKIDYVYECMGYTLLNLLDLLLMCHEKNGMLSRIIEKMLKTCCSIVMAITIDVFCLWAEIEVDGQVLQSKIAEKSYIFIEKYQKYPVAKELIAMLGNIAQKPKSVDEQIHKADVPTMISMINKADSYQKQWFRALLNTQVLKCKESVKCLERWAHLCTLGDISRLLNQSVLADDQKAKNVVVKCAATLEFEELVLATTRHFYQNGITHNLNGDVQVQLVVLFNKIKDKTISDEFSKELYLLILQNLEQTLSYIFAECLKNTFYSSNLVAIWAHIKEIITINDVGVRVLNDEINKCLPNEHNCKNYVELLNTLIGTDVFSAETIALSILLPLMRDSYTKENYDQLKYTLEILKELQGNILVKPETECIFYFLLDLMKLCRCKFLTFDSSKQEVTKVAVEVIQKYSELNKNVPHSVQVIKSEDDFFILFYRQRLFENESETDVLKHFFPINFENHAETVSHLIKILPLCVTPEWVMIISSLVEIFKVQKSIELLCDAMILVCEVVKSQDSKTKEVDSMLSCLKYSLQNVGVVIKECVQPRTRNIEDDVAVTKNVCRLIREIPNGNLKSEEGLSLASILSDESLRFLRPDKKFVGILASINESHICKMLAQKILS